jgi:hypothetical protein
VQQKRRTLTVAPTRIRRKKTAALSNPEFWRSSSLNCDSHADEFKRRRQLAHPVMSNSANPIWRAELRSIALHVKNDCLFWNSK